MSYDPIPERLARLQNLKPEWAIDYKAENGEVLLEVFVYRCPARQARGIEDLTEIKKVRFPAIEGKRVFFSPLAWLDEQIRRVTSVRAPSLS